MPANVPHARFGPASRFVGGCVWLLKKSISRDRRKSRRAKMPYKRFSLIAYIFLVAHLGVIFWKSELFNNYGCYRQL